MATANSYIQVSEVDFQDIRANLKTYLSSQDQFRDYDFEGSAISVLLDVLAYNTHYNAYYLNMIANEMFLDTAQQRESVVSRAKELGYTPASSQGPQANVNITFSGISSSVNRITVPKNSTFTTSIDDLQYTFVSVGDNVIDRNSSNNFTKDITIKEGVPLTHRFTVNTQNPSRYIIPNQNVDTTSIRVTVQESVSDTTTNEFTKATNIEEVLSTSRVYFLEEAVDGKYEIIFGSGSLGQQVKNGNIIIVEYLACNNTEANGAETFEVASLTLEDSVSYTSAAITTNTAASGGRNQETVSSIKFNAPKSYQTQNRAITNKDFQRIILTENSDLQSVIAFGGEEASPAVYGKVYIAVKPFDNLFATRNRKNQIRESVLDRTPLAVDPVVIDPEYAYIIPTINVFYDRNSTVTSANQIRTAVSSAIDSFSSASLERFGNKLRYSRFVRELDNLALADILNTEASLKIQKRVVPNTQRAERLLLNYNASVRTGTFSSTAFTFNNFTCFLDDDGLGNVRIYRFDSNRAKSILDSDAGTIDYTTGIVDVSQFAPTAFEGIEMQFTLTPEGLDVTPVREEIIIMRSSDATINVIGENV